jgi:flagellar motor switch protein FliN/FliY
VNGLLEQLRAGNALAAEAAQAINGAVQAAQEITGSIPGTSRSGEAQKAAPVAESAPLMGQVPNELRRLLAIEVPVIVQLGARRLTIGEVMRFSVGAIIEFHKSADEELDLLVNNKTVGKGHAVKVGENFGIKISTISPVKETIRKLGGI